MQPSEGYITSVVPHSNDVMIYIIDHSEFRSLLQALVLAMSIMTARLYELFPHELLLLATV